MAARLTDLTEDISALANRWPEWLGRASAWTGAASGALVAVAQAGPSLAAVFPPSAEVPLWLRSLPKEWTAAMSVAPWPLGPGRGVVVTVALNPELRLAFWFTRPDEAAADKVMAAANALNAGTLTGEIKRLNAKMESGALATSAFDALNRDNHLEKAAMAFTGLLAAKLAADRVSLCVFDAGHARLAALNHSDRPKRGGRFVNDLEAACEECADQGVPLVVPAPVGAPVVHRLADEYLRSSNAVAAVFIPILGLERDGVRPVRGVAVIELAEITAITPTLLATLARTAEICGPRWERLVLDGRPLLWRAQDKLRATAVWLVGPHHTGWKLAGVSAVVLALAGVFVPWPYSLRVPFTIKSATRHQITAPFDGRLASTSVARYDTVAAGAPLLALDVSDLQVERAEQVARLAERSLQADHARQAGKNEDCELAEAQARQSAAAVASLDHRIAQAKMCAPIAGAVMGQEPGERLGTAVKRGDTLLEIVSLDSLYVEMAVPGDRVDEVRRAWDKNSQIGGEIACEARPDDRLPVTARHLAPVVDMEDNHPVVRLRAPLDAAALQAGWVRPGVEGVARLDLGYRPVGYVVLRTTLDWIRTKLWI